MATPSHIRYPRPTKGSLQDYLLETIILQCCGKPMRFTMEFDGFECDQCSNIILSSELPAWLQKFKDAAKNYNEFGTDGLSLHDAGRLKRL
jgi:hypothetical protein